MRPADLLSTLATANHFGFATSASVAPTSTVASLSTTVPAWDAFGPEELCPAPLGMAPLFTQTSLHDSTIASTPTISFSAAQDTGPSSVGVSNHSSDSDDVFYDASDDAQSTAPAINSSPSLDEMISSLSKLGYRVESEPTALESVASTPRDSSTDILDAIFAPVLGETASLPMEAEMFESSLEKPATKSVRFSSDPTPPLSPSIDPQSLASSFDSATETSTASVITPAPTAEQVLKALDKEIDDTQAEYSGIFQPQDADTESVEPETVEKVETSSATPEPSAATRRGSAWWKPLDWVSTAGDVDDGKIRFQSPLGHMGSAFWSRNEKKEESAEEETTTVPSHSPATSSATDASKWRLFGRPQSKDSAEDSSAPVLTASPDKNGPSSTIAPSGSSTTASVHPLAPGRHGRDDSAFPSKWWHKYKDNTRSWVRTTTEKAYSKIAGGYESAYDITASIVGAARDKGHFLQSLIGGESASQVTADTLANRETADTQRNPWQMAKSLVGTACTGVSEMGLDARRGAGDYFERFGKYLKEGRGGDSVVTGEAEQTLETTDKSWIPWGREVVREGVTQASDVYSDLQSAMDAKWEALTGGRQE